MTARSLNPIEATWNAEILDGQIPSDRQVPPMAGEEHVMADGRFEAGLMSQIPWFTAQHNRARDGFNPCLLVRILHSLHQHATIRIYSTS